MSLKGSGLVPTDSISFEKWEVDISELLSSALSCHGDGDNGGGGGVDGGGGVGGGVE